MRVLTSQTSCWCGVRPSPVRSCNRLTTRFCCAWLSVPAGACVRVLTSQTSCVTCLGFSPDGQQLAAGTEDGTVAVYDLGSARRWARGGVDGGAKGVAWRGLGWSGLGCGLCAAGVEFLGWQPGCMCSATACVTYVWCPSYMAWFKGGANPLVNRKNAADTFCRLATITATYGQQLPRQCAVLIRNPLIPRSFESLSARPRDATSSILLHPAVWLPSVTGWLSWKAT